MTLNFKQGDVIVTQEAQKISLRRLGNKNIKQMSLYGIPEDLEKAARAVLEKQKVLTTLGNLFPSGEIKTEQGVYSLDTSVWISTSYSMAWFVQAIDGENIKLVAIGQNREAREKDYAQYLALYDSEKLPSLEEYMSADVMMSFLKGKAVHTLSSDGTVKAQIY